MTEAGTYGESRWWVRTWTVLAFALLFGFVSTFPAHAAPGGAWPYPDLASTPDDFLLDRLRSGNPAESNLASSELNHRRRVATSQQRVSGATVTRVTSAGSRSTAIVPAPNVMNPGVVIGPNAPSAYSNPASVGARRATWVARGARALNVVGVASLAGELIWTGYRTANPPPNWDWDSGTDPDISAGEPVSEPTWSGIGVKNPDYGHLDARWYQDDGDDGLVSVYEGLSPFGWPDEQKLRLSLPSGWVQPTYWIYSRTYSNEGVVCASKARSSAVQVWGHYATSDPNGASCASTGVAYVQLEDADGDVLGRAYPPGASIGNRARVVAEALCEHDGGGSDSTPRVETDWYDDHDDRPSLPTLHCPLGTQLVEAHWFRELEDGGRRSIVGTDWNSPGPDVAVEAGSDGRASTAPVLPLRPPSGFGLSGPGEQLVEDFDAEQGEDDEQLRWLERSGQDRLADPVSDFGWQHRNDRDQLYGCYLHRDGDVVKLPLDECLDFAWESDPNDPNAVRAPTRTTEGAPTNDPNETPETPPAPTLDTPSDAPTAPGVPGSPPATWQDCMDGGEDGSRFTSWIVFRGTYCALARAFVPQQVGQQLEQLRNDANARPPFSMIAPVSEGVEAFGDLSDGNCTVLQSFYPFVGDTDQIRSSESFDPRGSLPCQPAMNHVWQTVYGMVSLVIAAGGVISMFLLTSRALKGPS